MRRRMKTALPLAGAVLAAAAFALSSSAAEIGPLQLAQAGQGKGGGGPGGGGPGPRAGANRGGGPGPGAARSSPRGGGPGAGPRVRSADPGFVRPRARVENRAARPPREPRPGIVDRGPRRGDGVRSGRVDGGTRYYRRSGDWRRGTRYLWAPGFAFYLYDGYYYGDCDWLRRRAIATGSRIWWERYRRCRAVY
jgi:hypothetical protein